MFKIELIEVLIDPALPRVPLKVPEIVTEEEIKKLLQHCNLWNKLILLMLLDSDTRRFGVGEFELVG